MAFDQPTRNRLARFVKDARDLITDEFTQKFAERFGIADDGTCAPLEKLTHLDEPGLATAALLRQRIDYLVNSHPEERTGRAAAVKRLAREQAFTVLNRLAALRMAEKRQLILESVGKGYQSKGYKLYATVAGTGLGETYERYRRYLFCLCDELAVDLGALFDRHSPHGILFPREPALLGLLDLLNAADLEHLWAEDETIGWIYQYYNDESERKKMREQSSAPRNSRELAVRNQFFTPRYVVEFLTDNTLGRIWYEMTKGKTALRERCRYLVRRPNEVFLGNPSVIDHLAAAAPWVRDVILTADFSRLPEDPTLDELSDLGLAIDGYGEIERRSRTWDDFLATGYTPQVEAAEAGAHTWTGDAFELWCALFAYQRNALRHGEHARTDRASGNPVLRALWPALRQTLATPAESASQEELLRQPVFIPHRPIKDPRELRMLDPACGSMHFGLYAFDLFEVIYAEAYAAHADCGTGGLRSGSGGTALSAVATDPAAFAREVPRLIVEHNIHGVDIDPRAAQIAALSLWLRAQKSWSQQSIAAAARPRITRSHIVCAESMPGDKALLADFVNKAFPAAERPVFQHLLERIFDHMQLAGEAGSLLKIEEEIRTAIEEAKTLWEKSRTVSRELFSTEVINTTLRPGAQQELGGLVTAVSQLGAKADFWESAEERIYQALRRYSEQAETAGSVQRRLFANDAAQGFAFIDVCRQEFDVAVMNPPFGQSSKVAKNMIKATYASAWSDLGTCFIKRFLQKTKACRGFVGVLSSRTWMFLPRFSKFRVQELDRGGSIEALVDIGSGVLDAAAVSTCVSILAPNSLPWGAFISLRGEKMLDRETALLRHVHGVRSGVFSEGAVFGVGSQTFRFLPQNAFAYWVRDFVVTSFRTQKKISELFEIRPGLTTLDNDRFVRTCWEVSPRETGEAWKNFTKGGGFAPFVFETSLLLNWRNNGSELKAKAESKGGETKFIASQSFYFRKGLSYPQINKAFNTRILPSGFIFSNKSVCLFPNAVELDLRQFLALTNSRIFRYFLLLGSAGRTWEKGAVADCPVPANSLNYNPGSVDDIIKIRRDVLCQDEATSLFVAPLLPTGVISLAETSSNSQDRLISNEAIVAGLEAELNTVTESLYGFKISPEELAILQQSAAELAAEEQSDEDADEQEEAATSANAITFVANIISYTFGSVFGRWDIRYATGERPAPELPDPFAPLPVCPPGMLQGDDGLPLSPDAGRQLRTEGQYPLDVAWGGILVDDPEHPLDLVSRVQAALAIIWKDRAEAIEHEACELLGVATLRDWFRRPAGFFADHLKRYSKSRRQAPIYWPLSTKSGSYTLWIYYHRLSDQTLHTAIADFVEPKIKAVEATLASARAANRTGELAEAQEFLDELRDFKAELERLTKLPWRPNLNDGVLITACPLWKLFRFKKWQDELKACWEKLQRGDYDWAHLAYTLRPKEVEEKCKTDRSLAIAHGLEHLCQIEPPKPKAKRGKKAKATDEIGLE